MVAEEILSRLISFCFLTMSLCSIAVSSASAIESSECNGFKRLVVELISSIGDHGKRLHVKRKTSSWHLRLFVPKSFFIHMYMLASAIGFTLLLNDSIALSLSSSAGLSLCLFQVHVSRRLWECVFITEYGDSEMHLFGYLAGLLHYIMVPIAFHSDTVSFSTVYSPNLMVATTTFLLANYVQYQSHKTLYLCKKRGRGGHLTRGDKPKPSMPLDQSGVNAAAYRITRTPYRLPDNLLFQHVCCPHYSAEVLIYLSLLLVAPSMVRLSMLMWVTSNLASVANRQLEWYKLSNPLEVNDRRLKRMVPCVW